MPSHAVWPGADELVAFLQGDVAAPVSAQVRPRPTRESEACERQGVPDPRHHDALGVASIDPRLPVVSPVKDQDETDEHGERIIQTADLSVRAARAVDKLPGDEPADKPEQPGPPIDHEAGDLMHVNAELSRRQESTSNLSEVDRLFWCAICTRSCCA